MVNARYRLASRALYVNRGVVDTSETRVPLAQVLDVSVQWSIIQKRRRVGSLTVRYQAAGVRFPSMTELDSVPDPHALRDLILHHGEARCDP